MAFSADSAASPVLTNASGMRMNPPWATLE